MSPRDATVVHEMAIGQAARALRAGELSSVELTQAVLARIAATEPIVHAYVSVQADTALAAAREADTERRAGWDRGPLHGIPMAIKDIVDIAGLPTQCGSASRADAPPAARDARVVLKLRQAGAVIVGKTVTHEFAAGVLSPPTRNPWDPARIPGGSSGGSGASVAAGSSFAAIGSDTAGSIRIPASLNSVVGLKPTYDAVSREGVYPLSWSLDTIGPLARTVADAELVFQAIREAPTPSPPTPIGTNLSDARLGVPRPYFGERLQPDVRAAFEAAIAVFAGLGAAIVDVDWREASLSAAAGFVICRPELAAVHERSLRAAPHRYGPVLRSRLEAFSLLPGRDYLRARRAQAVVKRTIAALYRAHQLTALLTPTTPATATLADASAIVYPDGEEPAHAGFTRFTMPFNPTGQPALSLPCGLDRDRLPIGLQIVGRPDDESTICALARAFETATDLHLSPSPGSTAGCPLGGGAGGVRAEARG